MSNSSQDGGRPNEQNAEYAAPAQTAPTADKVSSSTTSSSHQPKDATCGNVNQTISLDEIRVQGSTHYKATDQRQGEFPFAFGAGCGEWKKIVDYPILSITPDHGKVQVKQVEAPRSSETVSERSSDCKSEEFRAPKMQETLEKMSADKRARVARIENIIRQIEVQAVAALTEALPKSDIDRLKRIVASDEDALKDVEAALNAILRDKKASMTASNDDSSTLPPRKPKLVQRIEAGPPIEDVVEQKRSAETDVESEPPDWHQLYGEDPDELAQDREHFVQAESHSESLRTESRKLLVEDFIAEQTEEAPSYGGEPSSERNHGARDVAGLPALNTGEQETEISQHYEQTGRTSPWFGGAFAGIIGGLSLASVVGGAVLFMSVENRNYLFQSSKSQNPPSQMQESAPQDVAAGFQSSETGDALASKTQNTNDVSSAVVPASSPTTLRAKVSKNKSDKLLASDVEGKSDKPISLSLSIHDLDPSIATIVRFLGMPPGATLSGGFNVGGGVWLVPRDKLSGLHLSVPHYFSGTFPLRAQILASDAITPVSKTKSFNVRIRPSGAPKKEDYLTASVVTPAPGEQQKVANSASSKDQRSVQVSDNRPASKKDLVEDAGETGEASSPDPSSTASAKSSALQHENSSSSSKTGEENKAHETQPSSVEQKTDVSGKSDKISAPTSEQKEEPSSESPQKTAKASTLTTAKMDAASADEAQSFGLLDPEIRKGHDLLQSGDIDGARKIFRKLADQGNPDAALALARSFDPVYFEQRKIPVKSADPKKALIWYREAIARGKSDAEKRIERLLAWIQK